MDSPWELFDDCNIGRKYSRVQCEDLDSGVIPQWRRGGGSVYIAADAAVHIAAVSGADAHVVFEFLFGEVGINAPESGVLGEAHRSS